MIAKELKVKITDVTVLHLRAPTATRSVFDGSYDSCVVEVHTDEGVSGIGEVDSVPAVIAAIVHTLPSHSSARGLREVLLGEDPMDSVLLWDLMYRATEHYGRRGVVVHAIGAIDIALWDLRGKVENRSVSRLLGGRKRERVHAYATLYPSGPTADELRAQLDRALALGLRAVKLVADPWWRDDSDRATQLLRTARAFAGDEVVLMLDAAAVWGGADEASPFLPLLGELDFRLLEAPLGLDDIAGHAAFQGWGIPIGGGDLGATTHHEFVALLDRGRIDVAQADLGMLGGYTEWQRLAHAVSTRGKRLMPHGYKSNLTLAANLHLLAHHWDREPLEYSLSRSPLRRHLTREVFPLRDGWVEVPDTPGLGVTLDEETVGRYRVR